MVDTKTYTRIARHLPFDRKMERVAVIYLGKSSAKQTQFVGSGTNGTARFDILEVVAKALRMKAPGIVLVHNHPSGALHASAQDRKVTRDLGTAAAYVGIDLVDHLVYANGKVVSIKGNQSFGQKARMGEVSDVSDETRQIYVHVHGIAHDIRKPDEPYSKAWSRAWGEAGSPQHSGHSAYHHTEAHELARKIRKDDEPYPKALSAYPNNPAALKAISAQAK